jgi:hypothetical protein
VIAGDNDLELRCELEKILSYEMRCDLLATSERLDPAFGPAPTFLRFD